MYTLCHCRTPLHFASAGKSLECVATLLDGGAENITNSDGMYPISLAKHEDIKTLLNLKFLNS